MKSVGVRLQRKKEEKKKKRKKERHVEVDRRKRIRAAAAAAAATTAAATKIFHAGPSFFLRRVPLINFAYNRNEARLPADRV